MSLIGAFVSVPLLCEDELLEGAVVELLLEGAVVELLLEGAVVELLLEGAVVELLLEGALLVEPELPLPLPEPVVEVVPPPEPEDPLPVLEDFGGLEVEEAGVPRMLPKIVLLMVVVLFARQVFSALNQIIGPIEQK